MAADGDGGVQAPKWSLVIHQRIVPASPGLALASAESRVLLDLRSMKLTPAKAK